MWKVLEADTGVVRGNTVLADIVQCSTSGVGRGEHKKVVWCTTPTPIIHHLFFFFYYFSSPSAKMMNMIDVSEAILNPVDYVADFL